jgi:hypothetical protein
MINTTAMTTLCLKLFGVILVLAVLLDYATQVFPFNFADPQWQLTVVTSLVERGLVPLVGMALILIAYWMDSMAPMPAKETGLDLRFPVYILAVVLGLMFLLLVPLHLNNLNQAKTAAIQQIEQGAGQGKEQIQQVLLRLDALSKNPEVLSQQIAQQTQVLESGQLNGTPLNPQQLEALKMERDQLKGLQEMAKNPAALQQKITEIKTQLEKQVQERQDKAAGEATGQALKQGLRIGLNSLMLAVAYATLGALGLRTVLARQGASPQV